MNQIINTIANNRKAAIAVAAAAALLLSLLAAIPFTAAALGTGFREEPVTANAVDTAAYAAALADAEAAKVREEQKDQQIQQLQAELEAERAASAQKDAQLAQSEERAARLESEYAAVWAELENAYARYELLLNQHSKKYCIVVKLVQDNWILGTEETRHNLYVSAEEYARIQVGDILQSHPDADFPSEENWSMTVINKYANDFEGVE